VAKMAYLVQGLALGFTAAVLPGAFQAFLIAASLRDGWRGGAPVAFAPLVSDAPIVFLTLFALNQMPAAMFHSLPLIGGLFVLYLAWRTWLSLQGEADTEQKSTPAVRTLWQGTLVNALGPGPYLFWATVAGPILLAGWRDAPWQAVAFLLGFYGAMVCTLLGLAVGFGSTRRLGPKLTRIMRWASLLLLVLFGLLLIHDGLQQLPWFRPDVLNSG